MLEMPVQVIRSMPFGRGSLSLRPCVLCECGSCTAKLYQWSFVFLFEVVCLNTAVNYSIDYR